MYIMLHIVYKMQVDLVSWTFKLNIFWSSLTWGGRAWGKSDVSTCGGGGSSSWQVLTRGRWGKNSQKFADIICEQSLNSNCVIIYVNQLIVFVSLIPYRMTNPLLSW